MVYVYIKLWIIHYRYFKYIIYSVYLHIVEIYVLTYFLLSILYELYLLHTCLDTEGNEGCKISTRVADSCRNNVWLHATSCDDTGLD